MSERVVLVTGASSGSGRSAAETFAARGWRVFGTSRTPRAETGLANRVTMLPLDVRDDEAPRACVEEVTRRAGRLDVLVNNAGIMLFGPAEEVPLAAAQALFETNFWGAVRMVNAALPVLRRQRSGHIVNVGSVAGTTAIPMNGFYAATKHALAGYTEALRHEVHALGVRVALVEPSDFPRPTSGARCRSPRRGSRRTEECATASSPRCGMLSRTPRALNPSRTPSSRSERRTLRACTIPSAPGRERSPG